MVSQLSVSMYFGVRVINLRVLYTYQSELEPAEGIITDNTTHLSSSHQ